MRPSRPRSRSGPKTRRSIDEPPSATPRMGPPPLFTSPPLSSAASPKGRNSRSGKRGRSNRGDTVEAVTTRGWTWSREGQSVGPKLRKEVAAVTFIGGGVGCLVPRSCQHVSHGSDRSRVLAPHYQNIMGAMSISLTPRLSTSSDWNVSPSLPRERSHWDFGYDRDKVVVRRQRRDIEET